MQSFFNSYIVIVNENISKLLVHMKKLHVLNYWSYKVLLRFCKLLFKRNSGYLLYLELQCWSSLSVQFSTYMFTPVPCSSTCQFHIVHFLMEKSFLTLPCSHAVPPPILFCIIEKKYSVYQMYVYVQFSCCYS